MPLTTTEIKEIKQELDSASRPLYFFHDDADGVASFLLLYRYVKEGSGVAVKSVPNVDEKFLKKVIDYSPDKIFIVDLAMVEQEFIDKSKTKVIWIDHHTPLKRYKVKYYNPRLKNKSEITSNSFLCYQVVQQDLWIAMAGIIGDWTFPELTEQFKKEYPDLLPIKVNKPDQALFETKIGELSRIFSFILKGKTQDAMKCVKILTRIKTPYEILNQETSAGTFVWKRYQKINKPYQELLADAKEAKPKGKILLYTYADNKMSFTGELSNELLYHNPDKVIIISRKKSGEYRCSLRSGKDIILLPLLEKALIGVNGYGGGHEHACGASIKEEDFERFLDNLRKQL